jgi:hypothetical protein
MRGCSNSELETICTQKLSPFRHAAEGKTD